MTAPGPPDLVRSAYEQSARGSAVWYAERESLGVLVRDPDRLHEVAPWLHGHDFGDLQHGQVFAVLTELHAAGALAPPHSPDGITRNVLAVRDALRSRPFMEGAVGAHDLVMELVEAGAGVTDERFAANGHKIVQMSARRQIESWGVVLEIAAASTELAHGDPSEFYQTFDSIMTNLADVDVQVRRSAGEVISRLAEPAGPVLAVPPTTPLPHSLVTQSELRLIHAVLADDPAWRDSGVVHRFRPTTSPTLRMPRHGRPFRRSPPPAGRSTRSRWHGRRKARPV